MTVESIDTLTAAIRDHLCIAEKQDPGVLEDAYETVAADGGFMEAELIGVLAQDAVNAIIAPALWRRAIGPTLDTSQVSAKLGISRQALAQRVTHRSLLALPGRRTRRYPSWQFGSDTIRPIVATILRRWYQAEPQIEPETIAVWAATPVPSGRDQPVRPGELIASGTGDAVVLALLDDTIARRTR
jgi:hypothetical protein